MKKATTPIKFLLTLLLLSSGARASANDALASWSAENATMTGGTINVRPTAGTSALTGPAEGIAIADDAAVGKILTFSGSQTDALSAGEPILPSSQLRVTAKVRLQKNPAWGAVLRMSDLEIRHLGSRGALALIVWPAGQDEGSSIPEITIPEQLGEWITITATVIGNKMKISAAGKEAEQEFTGEFASKPRRLALGFAAGRPLIGDVAEVKIEHVNE